MCLTVTTRLSQYIVSCCKQMVFYVSRNDSDSCVRKDVEVRVLSSASRNAGRARPEGRRINFRLRSKIILSSMVLAFWPCAEQPAWRPPALEAVGWNSDLCFWTHRPRDKVLTCSLRAWRALGRGAKCLIYSEYTMIVGHRIKLIHFPPT